jgi:hypothetical protein
MPSVHQLKITLLDTRPAVWRRVQVLSDTTLAELHGIIQAAMGWENYHLHRFEVGWDSYGGSEDDGDESRVRLGEVAGETGTTFGYEYDFGDCWQHSIVVEKVIPTGGRRPYPVCLGGGRACPPEDVGGPWGYEHFRRVMAARRGPEYREYREWCGAFDPAHFSLDAVNAALRGMHQYAGTKSR